MCRWKKQYHPQSPIPTRPLKKCLRLLVNLYKLGWHYSAFFGNNDYKNTTKFRRKILTFRLGYLITDRGFQPFYFRPNGVEQVEKDGSERSAGDLCKILHKEKTCYTTSCVQDEKKSVEMWSAEKQTTRYCGEVERVMQDAA